MKNAGVLTLPGSYLGRENQGKGYVRIALVYDNDITQKALLKLKEALILYKTLDKKEQEWNTFYRYWRDWNFRFSKVFTRSRGGD